MNESNPGEPRPSCQVCGSRNLDLLLDLGYQPLCNEFLPHQQAHGPQQYYPLRLCHCRPCSLVQLDYVIPTGLAFGQQYTYLTGSSRSLVEYFSQLALRLVDQYGLEPGDTVVEIGSNDGTFLRAFASLGMNVLGVEGSTQPASIATDNGIPTIPKFFGPGLSSEIKERLPQGSKIRLVVAMNVLAHTDNINQFLPEVVELLESDAIFVSQSHWLAALIRQFEFDTVYHEHLRYYTLESLIKLFAKHDLTIVDAETNDFYGGSVLSYARRGAGTQSSRLQDVLAQEEQINIPEALRDMKQVLLKNKAALQSLLVELKTSGKRVVGVGAPMKASTLLNFYGVTSDVVEYLAEVNELKVGTVTPGVRIPVVHEDEVFQNQPDYAMILSWNMADAIMPKYREAGYTGKFILPVPEVKVVE